MKNKQLEKRGERRQIETGRTASSLISTRWPVARAVYIQARSKSYFEPSQSQLCGKKAHVAFSHWWGIELEERQKKIWEAKRKVWKSETKIDFDATSKVH